MRNKTLRNLQNGLRKKNRDYVANNGVGLAHSYISPMYMMTCLIVTQFERARNNNYNNNNSLFIFCCKRKKNEPGENYIRFMKIAFSPSSDLVQQFFFN